MFNATDGELRTYNGITHVNLSEFGLAFVHSDLTHINSGINYTDTEQLTISGGINYITGTGEGTQMYLTGGNTNLVAQSGVRVHISGGHTTIDNSGTLFLTPDNVTTISGITHVTGADIVNITGGTGYL